jgi:hypothetical protein
MRRTHIQQRFLADLLDPARSNNLSIAQREHRGS